MKLAEKLNVIALTIAIVSSLGVSAASANMVVPDQSYFPDTTGGFISFAYPDSSAAGIAQTFTVGQTGTLAGVEIHLANTKVPTELLILQTSGGVPIGGLSGTVVLASTSSSTFVSDGFATDPDDQVRYFDFSAAGLSVNVGDLLAFQAISDSANGFVPVYGNNPNHTAETYDGGHAFSFAGPSNPDWVTYPVDGDFRFRTYVSVPEPMSAALLMLGGLMLTARRRR